MTRRVGLIGFPVEHSLSPAFQQAAFDACGIEATYELWSTPEDEIPARIESLREPGTFGANVTVPHKQRAFQHVDEASKLATRAASVNTIVNRDGRIYGDNTDIPGFLAPLREMGVSVESAHVVVLGAGGAARGVVVALLTAGCTRITVANRTVERARQLRDDLGEIIQPASLGDDLSKALASTTLLVNSTAIGWDDDALPISQDQFDLVSRDALIYDLTYRSTGLLRAAAKHGIQTIDGLPMLVHQGAESFRLWTGQEPPIDVMMRAALDARRAND